MLDLDEGKAQRLEDENTSLREEKETDAEYIEDLLGSIRALKDENEALKRRVETLQSQVEVSPLSAVSKFRCEDITVGKKLGQGAFGAVFRGAFVGGTG